MTEIQGTREGSTLSFSMVQVFVRPGFLDYLRSGWQISLVAAIDFTASNGLKAQPSGLHYVSDSSYNAYEQALLNVGNIIEPYDQDKMFPVFGFGGAPRFMGLNTVSHCFPLNGDQANPNIAGIQGIH